jgi:hypothetical protein
MAEHDYPPDSRNDGVDVDDWGWYEPPTEPPAMPKNLLGATYSCPQCQDTAFIPVTDGKAGYSFVRPCDECHSGAALTKVEGGWWTEMQKRRANRKAKPENHRLHGGPASPSKWHEAFRDRAGEPE